MYLEIIGGARTSAKEQLWRRVMPIALFSRCEMRSHARIAKRRQPKLEVPTRNIVRIMSPL